jgi:ATP-dependent DNA helicase RecQ
MTVESHLSFYVGKGELDLRLFVNEDKERVIREAIDTYGNSRLKTLKDNLPLNYSYTEIKMVVAAKENG